MEYISPFSRLLTISLDREGAFLDMEATYSSHFLHTIYPVPNH